jgi:hypothetical protein
VELDSETRNLLLSGNAMRFLGETSAEVAPSEALSQS